MMFVVHCLCPGGSGDLVLYQISWGSLTRYVVIITSLMTAITVSSLPNDDHYHSGDKWYASDHAADVKHLRRGKTKHVNDKSHVYCGSQFLWWTGRKLEKHLTVLVKIFKAHKNRVLWMICHILWLILRAFREWWLWRHKLELLLRRSFSN